MKKVQTNSLDSDTHRAYMYFPADLYFRIKRSTSTKGYTKRELYYDHHVKDKIIELLEKGLKIQDIVFDDDMVDSEKITELWNLLREKGLI